MALLWADNFPHAKTKLYTLVDIGNRLSEKMNFISLPIFQTDLKKFYISKVPKIVLFVLERAFTCLIISKAW